MKFLLKLEFGDTIKCDWPVLPRQHETIAIGETAEDRRTYTVATVTYQTSKPEIPPDVVVYALEQFRPKSRFPDSPKGPDGQRRPGEL